MERLGQWLRQYLWTSISEPAKNFRIPGGEGNVLKDLTLADRKMSHHAAITFIKMQINISAAITFTSDYV